MSFHPKMTYDATWHKSVRRLAEPGPPFAYTPDNLARFETIVARYPPDRRRSAVLPALYLAQYQQGYITANAIRHVAELLGITRADVEDVVSDGTNRPWRIKSRAPSLLACQALEQMIVGGLIADVIAVIGSIDVVMGDVDR